MFFFLKNFIFFSLILELTPILNSSDFNNHILNNIFIYVFLFCFVFNILLDQGINYNLNFDLVFKYFSFFSRNISFLLNYFITTIKKILLFLYNFKYRHIRKSLLLFSKNYVSLFFLWWRPLFKKTSYFGYFRSNRSKWIK